MHVRRFHDDGDDGWTTKDTKAMWKDVISKVVVAMFGLIPKGGRETAQYSTKLSSNWGDFRIVLCHNKAAYSCIITNCFDSVFNDSSPRPHRRATVLYPPNIETFSRAFLEFCVVFDLFVKYKASCEANVLVLCSVSIVLKRYDSAVYYLPLCSNKLITFSWSLSQV